MFWTEEDIQPVVSAAEEVFGKQGQYSDDPFVFVGIEHAKFGTVWYGDVSGTYETIREFALNLTAKTGEQFNIVDFGTLKTIC